MYFSKGFLKCILSFSVFTSFFISVILVDEQEVIKSNKIMYFILFNIF